MSAFAITGPNGGSMTLIQTQVLGSNTASVTFSSIVDTYEHLQLIWQARSTATAEAMRLRFNNDTGANYDYEELVGSGATPASSNGIGQTSGLGGTLVGSGETTNKFASGTIDVPFYKRATVFKSWVGNYQDIRSGGHAGVASGQWLSTSAVTRFDVFPASGSFLTGSAFSLYGIS